jgi:excinuclease ABC subunit C
VASDLSFRPATGDIPTDPGVYRFLDERGRVLYVGKAKNLKNRLTSYFGPLNKQHERTRRMLVAARDVTWTVVRSEYEALQLEFTWIKEFDPPFNVRFRDDKSYPYLAISMTEEVPRVFITRNRELKGLRYFGPYTQAWAIRETLDTLLKVFPMRSCSAGVFAAAKKQGRPCLLAEIGKCAAPCVGRITPEDHRALARKLGDFVHSGDDSTVKDLKKRMLAASDADQFELAAALRDDAAALERVLERSTVVFSDQTDADLIGLFRDELTAAASIFIVRGGRIRGNRSLVVDLPLEVTDAELVRDVLQQIYSPKSKAEAVTVPKEILVPIQPEDAATLADWLTDLRGASCTLRVAQRGDKAKLADTARINAKNTLASYKLKRASDFTTRADALAGIQRALGLATAPLRIECYDISHLSGEGTVASMVVFEDGLAKRDQYRKFNLETADDTESIYRALGRRLKYLNADSAAERFGAWPQLLLIDGGEPQLNAASRALRDAGLEIPVAAIAKRLEEVWVPGGYPVIFARNSEELFLLQRIRDEAHRFAITAQRKSRSKSVSSELLEIEGLGETRARLLLRRFGSLKRLKLATVEEITDLPGFGPQLAQRVKLALSADSQNAPESAD